MLKRSFERKRTTADHGSAELDRLAIVGFALVTKVTFISHCPDIKIARHCHDQWLADLV